MNSYEEITSYLEKGKNPNDRPAPNNGNSNNTRIIRTFDDDCVGIRLHDTVIVKYFKNGNIQLNTDGWRTVTTRNRINYYTPDHISITQTKFIWFLFVSGKEYLYTDDLIISGNQVTLHNENYKPYDIKELKQIEKKKAKADKFCKKFIDKFFNQEIPKPSGGDCWLCLMIDQNDVNYVDYPDHIMGHVNSNYYVPSLLHNAIKESKGLFAPIDFHNIAYFWKQDGWKEQKPFAEDMTRERLTNALKRYVRKRIGLGIT